MCDRWHVHSHYRLCNSRPSSVGIEYLFSSLNASLATSAVRATGSRSSRYRPVARYLHTRPLGRDPPSAELKNERTGHIRTVDHLDAGECMSLEGAFRPRHTMGQCRRPHPSCPVLPANNLGGPSCRHQPDGIRRHDGSRQSWYKESTTSATRYVRACSLHRVRSCTDRVSESGTMLNSSRARAPAIVRVAIRPVATRAGCGSGSSCRIRRVHATVSPRISSATTLSNSSSISITPPAVRRRRKYGAALCGESRSCQGSWQ